MKKLLCILILLSLSMLQGDVYAQSKTKTIDGVAIDSKGIPLPDGKRLITFLIYDGAESDTPLWSEQQNIVIEDGRFTAKLGSVTPFDLPDNEQYWLGMRVGDGAELSPRLQLTLAAESVASVPGGWDDDGTVVRLTTSSDLVGIGIASPSTRLHVTQGGSLGAFKVGGASSAQLSVELTPTNTSSVANSGGIFIGPFMDISNTGQGVSFAPQIRPTANISLFVGMASILKAGNSSSNFLSLIYRDVSPGEHWMALLSKLSWYPYHSPDCLICIQE